MSAKLKISKSILQQYHFHSAFKNRVGEDCSMETYVLLKDQIIQNRALHIKKQSNRITIKGVTYKGQIILVVYDKTRKTMVTVLPECDDAYNLINDAKRHFKPCNKILIRKDDGR